MTKLRSYLHLRKAPHTPLSGEILGVFCGLYEDNDSDISRAHSTTCIVIIPSRFCYTGSCWNSHVCYHFKTLYFILSPIIQMNLNDVLIWNWIYISDISCIPVGTVVTDVLGVISATIYVETHSTYISQSTTNVFHRSTYNNTWHRAFGRFMLRLAETQLLRGSIYMCFWIRLWWSLNCVKILQNDAKEPLLAQ